MHSVLIQLPQVSHTGLLWFSCFKCVCLVWYINILLDNHPIEELAYKEYLFL